MRKGSATSASSGTTCPPPVSSIAARGEWSLGEILDIYWHFADLVYHYLGRVLALLDPTTSPDFATLPPHWNMSDPMGNPKVKEAMHLMFATILQKWSGLAVDPTGVLLICLASAVYHSNFLKQIAAETPGHPFVLIPLLSNPVLLADLKELVTLEPEGQMTTPTGIPPHVTTATGLQKVLTVCTNTLENVKDMTKRIEQSVKGAFEDKAEENGQVTGERLKQMLATYQTNMASMIDEKLTELRKSFPNVTGAEQPPQDEEEVDDTVFEEGREEEVSVEDAMGDGNTLPTRITYRQYSYDGCIWHVPKAFKFPTGMHLDTAWKIWLYGLPANKMINANGTRCQAPIRPFCSIKLEMLPKAVKQDFQLHWRPVFSMMEQAPNLHIRQVDVVDATYVATSFETVKSYLKTRVSYIFQKRNRTQTCGKSQCGREKYRGRRY
jgi:hypothetical protein